MYKLEQLNFHDWPFKKIMAPMPNQWFLCSPETDHDNSKPGMISIPPIFMTRYGKSVKMDVYGIGFTTLNCIDMVVFFAVLVGFSRFWMRKKSQKSSGFGWNCPIPPGLPCAGALQDHIEPRCGVFFRRGSVGVKHPKSLEPGGITSPKIPEKMFLDMFLVDSPS